MMRNLRSARLLGALALTVALSGCATQIYQQELVRLDQGLEVSAATSRLSQPPSSRHDVAVGETRYAILRYLMNNGMQAAPYFLAFEEGKLRYWGYVDEFRRHPDRRLGAAIDQVVAALAAESRR
jgi:hypothetical protein